MLRWFQFTTHPLQLRDEWKDCDVTLSRFEVQSRYLQSIPEFLACSSRILGRSSSDPSEPPDHHVIRAQTFAVLSGLRDVLHFLDQDGKQDLGRFSNKDVDNLSDVVNGLVLSHLVFFPLVQIQDEHGDLWQYRLLRIYTSLYYLQPFIRREAPASLHNFKSAVDAFRHQYQSWKDARQVILSVCVFHVLTRVCDCQFWQKVPAIQSKLTRFRIPVRGLFYFFS